MKSLSYDGAVVDDDDEAQTRAAAGAAAAEAAAAVRGAARSRVRAAARCRRECTDCRLCGEPYCAARAKESPRDASAVTISSSYNAATATPSSTGSCCDTSTTRAS